jgi:hypothetical protein
MCFGEDQEHATYFRNRREQMVQALTIPIQHAIQEGHIRQLDPQAVAHMILGNIEGLQIHLILGKDSEACSGTSHFDPEPAAHFLTSMLLDGLSTPTDAGESVSTTQHRSHA